MKEPLEARFIADAVGRGSSFPRSIARCSGIKLEMAIFGLVFGAHKRTQYYEKAIGCVEVQISDPCRS